jgi:hypothetical protein
MMGAWAVIWRWQVIQHVVNIQYLSGMLLAGRQS